MSNLSFVGLSDDGSALILSSPDGTRHRLAIDERLRSAVRSGRSRMEAPDAPVSARDIQARLRAGATPTEVAEFSGWSVERVEAFAAPILQERGWVAQKAQKCPIGRGEDDPDLGEIVARRLGERGIDVDTTRWDSWRREDGLWTVLLAYPAGKGDRVATWQFDMEANSLTAEDDEARWFTEDRIPAEQRPRLIRVPDDDAPPPPRPPESGNHPAGRARRDSGTDAVGQPAEQPQQRPASGAVGHKPAAQSDSPRWDEVLFGPPPGEER
jgi:hypothetical protein